MPETKPHTGTVTPQDVADPSKHQGTSTAETGNRPSEMPAGEETRAKRKHAAGEDMKAEGEKSVGKSRGPDTSGAVAVPSGLGQPGASSDLDGTPGALSTGSAGRSGNH